MTRPMKGFLGAVTVLLILCLAVAAALLYEQLPPELFADRAAAPAVVAGGAASLGQFTVLAQPRPAPALRFATLDGKPASLADFRGKLVLVNLWATWCGPCIKEMPSLQRLQAKLGTTLTILAISEDRGGAATVAPFRARLGLTALAPYVDPQNAGIAAFGADGLPTSFLIGRDGRILGTLLGAADWDSPRMLAVLKPYLKPDAS